jgi:phosphoribosylformylglycinamidine synthase
LTYRLKIDIKTNRNEAEMLTLHRRDDVTGTESSQIWSVGINLAEGLRAEWCYYILVGAELTIEEMARLRWLLGETYDPDGLSLESFLTDSAAVLEVGPRLSFETPWSSTARQVCHQVGLEKVLRIERSRRYGFAQTVGGELAEGLLERLHDCMTQMPYADPLTSFETDRVPEPVREIQLLTEGMDALRAANERYGLAMDEHDLQAYFDLFANVLGRNPTDVELFQLGVANSEHSRHGYFKGRLRIDGVEMPDSLMDIVKRSWRANPGNSKSALHDDSSAIEGGEVLALVPEVPGQPGPMVLETRVLHPTLTAETHNHPTGNAPYAGAETGGGGRQRDILCPGRGGLLGAGGVGLCVANLHIPGYDLPWEDDGYTHPSNLASPFQILIWGSNGAFDYGNCDGEPTIIGHVRTFGMLTPDGYRAWFKPILYSEGTGLIDDRHVEAGFPEADMLVVQIGGPAYRIGLGGGSASSLMSGDNAAELDFDSVQRGDAEMQQRTIRVIRACVELGDRNPIISAHDLGAGGDSNALPEIVYPAGGRIYLRGIPLGDQSLSVLEIWGNESQERNALLVRVSGYQLLAEICERENVPCATVGVVTNDSRLVLFDSVDGSTPVDLPLERILGKQEPRVIELESVPITLEPLVLPEGITVWSALDRVLRMVAVGSKRWLTSKVDRSVTGLVAQQQCVGPFHTPLSDYAVLAHSLFGNSGTALSQGERPLIGLIDPSAQGRMTVAEALLNLAGAKVTDIRDIKCSGNWMWAAKLPGEGPRLYDAAVAMSNLMVQLGVAIDGGKDSLSMAAKYGDETVKAPGQLVLATYAKMSDVTAKVTPELQAEGNQLVLIDLSYGEARLGGSALAQAYKQLGDTCPDVEDEILLREVFESVQDLVGTGLVASLHDRSDGGLVVTLIEMAIAGNFGATVKLGGENDVIPALFSEELGLVLEVKPEYLSEVRNHLDLHHIPNERIGTVGPEGGYLRIIHDGEEVLNRDLHELRARWEATSSQLEELQADPECARAEFDYLTDPVLRSPDWRLCFEPRATPPEIMEAEAKPVVAVLRQEGSNGDREMIAALMAAGFNVWDVTMSDLLAGRVHLRQFQGVVFPGGFSFGDVLDAGKGWAGVIRYNHRLVEQFEEFYARSDTFSLGVCNGAQLMLLLGWAPFKLLPDELLPRFVKNRSGRFESRFTTVQILPSPAMMFRGMVGSQLGVWVAHGEGRLVVPEMQIHYDILDQELAPLRFVDEHSWPTEAYPLNPNGSPEGITALCSPDGRHLAMMPHPERLSNQLWQWPYLPESWEDFEASPWLRMFQNAREWCANV